MVIERCPESMIRLQGATGLVCLPVVFLVRKLMLPSAPSLPQALMQAPLVGWLPVAYVVLASFAIAQVLWGRAIGAIGVAATAPFALLIPVFGVALAWLLVGERLSTQLLLSATVVLLGVGVHVLSLLLQPASVR
ncbi:hypothetical protein D5047_04020 [Verminephrobacter eiseniae]|nr:hypothetical protein [Verminephrobacter eiseniae]